LNIKTVLGSIAVIGLLSLVLVSPFDVSASGLYQTQDITENIYLNNKTSEFVKPYDGDLALVGDPGLAGGMYIDFAAVTPEHLDGGSGFVKGGVSLGTCSEYAI